MPENYIDKLDTWSSHMTIANLLREFQPGIRVLDVGTATGTIGRLCKDRGFQMRGIEPVAKWAEISRPFYDEVCVGSLQQIPDEYLTGHQVVVCADVLEHMADPEEQLERLARLQPADAVFIISVPNVANIWVRLHLLLGKFDYTDRGILDRTHLRFFTYRTLKELVNKTGLAINTMQPTPIPLNLVSSFFANHPVGRWIHGALAFLTRRFPTLLGYQFVLTAKKR